MPTRNFRHRVERTRNKHSRAVCQGDTIIIRLARNLSRTEEQEHIQSLLRRMTRLILEERQKTLVDPFRPLFHGNASLTLPIAGTTRSYQFVLRPGARTRARRTRTGWNVDVSPQIRKAALHRFLWSLLSKEECERIARMVQQVNRETYRVQVRAVKLRFATTQWGSCSPRGTIMLNTALLFVPPSILRYVIIHELAHRRHPNHSDAYWREVERGMPTYRRAYRELHQYRLPHAS